jgi:hypothetical protein
MNVKLSKACLFLLIVAILACSNDRRSYKREIKIQENLHADSIKYCGSKRDEAIEQIKRGNIILYRNLDNFMHASEYLLDNYGIILIPANEWNLCSREIMDSVVHLTVSEKEIQKIKGKVDSVYLGKADFITKDGYYIFANKYPEYPGGIDSLYKDLYKQVPKIEDCSIDLLYGSEIRVQFVIDVDGSIKESNIIKKLCPMMDKKIIDAFSNLNKKWVPAIYENNHVPFQMVISIDWGNKAKV